VFEGLVAVNNGLGSGIFAAREYFFVPDGEAPKRWLAPPLFLSDNLSGRPETAKQAPAEITFTKVPEFLLDVTLPVPPFIYVVTEDLNRSIVGPLTIEGNPVIVIGSDRYILELDTAPPAVIGFDGSGGLASFNNASLAASRGSAQLLDAGADASAQVSWGRWAGPGSTIVSPPDGTGVRNDGGNLHYIYGTAATALPTSGVFQYSFVGGTSPTDSTNGAAGRLISGGSVNVDFGAAQVALSGLSVGFGSATYTLAGSTSFNGSGLFSTSPGGAGATCTGVGCKPLIAGNFAGFLSGPGGAGLGLDYFFNVPGGVIEGVAGYRKCPNGKC
jgi:hypothetical protein